MEQQICKIDRWRYVGQGDVGHIWEDTVNHRFVVSDQYGPNGMVPSATGSGSKRGVRQRENVQFQAVNH